MVKRGALIGALSSLVEGALIGIIVAIRVTPTD